ncbi:hypothetical protein [Pseudomonas extremaustralis]
MNKAHDELDKLIVGLLSASSIDNSKDTQYNPEIPLSDDYYIAKQVKRDFDDFFNEENIFDGGKYSYEDTMSQEFLDAQNDASNEAISQYEIREPDFSDGISQEAIDEHQRLMADGFFDDAVEVDLDEEEKIEEPKSVNADNDSVVLDDDLMSIADQMAEAIALAETLSDLDEPVIDESKFINGDRVSIDEGFEDAFIGVMDKDTRSIVSNTSMLNKLLKNETDEEQRKILEEKIRINNATLNKNDREEVQKWKTWAKEREFNPKAPSPDDDFLRLLKELGLTKKSNYNISLNGMGFKLVDSVNKRTILEKKSGRCLISRSNVNEKTISLALMSVGNKEGKAVWVYEPKPNSHEGTEQYYRSVIETAIKLQADGKIMTNLDDIKIGNKFYKYILDEYKEKHHQTAAIGAEQVSRNSNEQRNGVGDEIKPKVEKSNLDKHVFDATYSLEKSLEKTINRVKKRTSLVGDNAKYSRATLDAIGDILQNRPYQQKAFTKADYVAISAFVDLNNEMNAYKAQMSKLENVTPEIAKNLEIINKLQETGFNPYTKNKKIGMMLTDTATLSMRKVLMSLEVLDGSIRRGIDLDYASTRYDKTGKVFEKKMASFAELEGALKNNDLSKISNRVDVVSGFTLNRVLHKDAALSKSIFPDDKKVTKFTLSGESTDLYFFEGKNGNVYQVKGNGNKYSKPEISTLTMLQVNELSQKVSSQPDLDVAPKAAPAEPVKPANADVSVDIAAPAVAKEEPVKAPAVENAVPVATNETPEKAPAVDATQPVSAKADTAPIEPKVETYSVQGHKNNDDFDMTFTDGVCVRNSIAYFIKGQVDNKTVVDDIKADYPDVKQIKKLPYEPTEEYDLNHAKIEWKTELPFVNDCLLVPTSNGYCLYIVGDAYLNREELTDTVNILLEKNNITIEAVNGAWRIQEHHDDIHAISGLQEGYVTSFKEGYNAIQVLKGLPTSGGSGNMENKLTPPSPNELKDLADEKRLIDENKKAEAEYVERYKADSNDGVSNNRSSNKTKRTNKVKI